MADSISPGNLKSEQDHRSDICIAGRWMQARQFVIATDGNISVRLDAGRILISPGATCKGNLLADDLVIADMDGHPLTGCRAPSSEIAMHLLIYRSRPDVNAVCHAHPPTATGYAAAGLALNKALIAEVVLCLGCVPLAPYGTPGTPELSATLAPLVDGHDAILMANHGVVTYGHDLLTAFYRMETVEHFAKVSLVTELLGKQNLLSNRDVEKLAAARGRYGIVAPSPKSTQSPITSDAESARRVSITREELDMLIEEAVRKDRAIR